MKPFTVPIEITAQQIADLFESAIDGGDPVTTASRGGWCDGIYLMRNGKQTDDFPYFEAKTYERHFVLEIIEIDDETLNHKTAHKVDRSVIITGLQKMARQFPERFGQIVTDNIDAPCADIFLQCVLFGEEKYA